MNRLTARIARRRRGCDVGVQAPVTMNATTYLLHRQGEHSTDRYGCDLAVTVQVPERNWLKTAAIQLKRVSGLSVQVEAEQLAQAEEDDRICQRAFLLAVDENRRTTRLRSIAQLRHILPQGQKTTTVQCDEWEELSQWFAKWLRCEVGIESDASDTKSVEGLLQRYVVEPSRPSLFHDESDELPENYRPARAWMHAQFTSQKESMEF